jgi:xanthosine utilization system XapX-like protein
MSRTALIGLAVGLWLGFIWVVWDFGDMVLVALLGLVGYVVGRLLSGDLDLSPVAARLGLRR